MKLLVILMMLKSMKGQPFKDRAIVLAANGFSHNLVRAFNAALAGNVVDDGAVELFLGGEVAEDDCFGDAHGMRNLLGGRAAKAALRKELDGDAYYLAPALFG